MKAIAISLIIGMIVGFGAFCATGFIVRKGKDRKKTTAELNRDARKRKDEDDDFDSKCVAGGKQKKIIPRTEWKRGRSGGCL